MSITRCSFKSVRDLVLSWSGQVKADLSAAQVLQVDSFINRSLRDWAWPAWNWPELTYAEKRFYRADYASGTAYSAPTATAASEVYFPATQQYYQALKATTGNAPATLSGSTWSTNDAYWAVASGPYTGSDWLASTAYVATNIVRNTTDGRYYQCHTAHTSTSTFDSTKFGILTIFDPYVSRTQTDSSGTALTVIGDFLGVYLDDPHVWPDARRVPFYTDNLGAHVQTSPRGRRWQRGITTELVPSAVWVRFRLKCPDFLGSVWASGSTYTATTDFVYFEGTGVNYEGDYWQCVTNTSTGESPSSATSKWTRLEFPAWLRTCVARKAYADWLRAGAQREAATVEDGSADDNLFSTQIEQGAMQAQTLRWRKTA